MKTKYAGNLFVQIEDEKVTALIMPDIYGELTGPAPTGKGWWLVEWPTMPHFTGESTIRDIIDDRYPYRTPVARS